MSDSFFGQFQFLLSQKKVLGNSLCLLVLEKMLFSDEKQIKQQNLQLLLVIFKCQEIIFLYSYLKKKYFPTKTA
jgi:hypothetical protein